MAKPFLLIVFFLTVLCKAQLPEPVAGYSFNDGTAKDKAGKNNAKAIGVSYVEDRFGNDRSACFVHGNPGSYLNLGTSPLLKPEKATISIWVMIDIVMLSGRGRAVNPILITKNNHADDFFEAYTLSYDYEDQKIVAATTNSEFEQRTLHSSKKFPLQEWHHLVLTYDNNFASLYIDGHLEIKMAKGFKSQFLSTDSVVIGTMAQYKNQRSLCGTVDDIEIFDRVLSPAEIKTLYEAPDPNRNSIYLAWTIRIIILVAAMGLVLWLILRGQRKKYEKEKEINRINSKMLELETKAVRSQMNPHFIFNSLNTLLRFILQEDYTNSHLYLTKFSLLLRKLLETSSTDSISLAEEMDILNLYVEIEKLRFSDQFEFEISSDIPNPNETHIPFMLVQPFAENAIWHGLLHKEGPSLLKIVFTDIDSRSLKCVIEDNGVGRKASGEENKYKGKRSMGIELIRQRLSLLENSTAIKCPLVITDNYDKDTGIGNGTRIEILIPKLNL